MHLGNLPQHRAQIYMSFPWHSILTADTLSLRNVGVYAIVIKTPEGQAPLNVRLGTLAHTKCLTVGCTFRVFYFKIIFKV